MEIKREIKFRVLLRHDSKTGQPSWFKWEYVDVNESIDTLTWTVMKKASPFLQFTGLKDKNGKEIFEGDIMKFTHHGGYNMESCIMEVCFDNDCASFGYKTNISIFPEIIFPFSTHDEVKKDVLNHCEIIGNIYENPELLK